MALYVTRPRRDEVRLAEAFRVAICNEELSSMRYRKSRSDFSQIESEGIKFAVHHNGDFPFG